MGESRRDDRITLRSLRGRLITMMLLAPLFLFAQSNDSIPAKKDKPKKEKKEQEILELNGNIYKIHSGYMNFGFGAAYLISQNIGTVCGGVGYNFRFKDRYYKIGYERTDNISFFGTSNTYLNDFHIAAGKRFPSKRFNLSYFYGGSFYNFHDNANPVKQVNRGLGLYGEASAFFKPVYDIGLGLTGFANMNIHAPVVGLRLDFYFSGAYKGKKS
jgi:hypothetical protein